LKRFFESRKRTEKQQVNRNNISCYYSRFLNKNSFIIKKDYLQSLPIGVIFAIPKYKYVL